MRIETLTANEPLDNPAVDPLAGKTANLAGKIAVCSIGYLGRIERRAFMPYGKWAWCGTSMRGLPWSSTKPVVLDSEDQIEMNKIFDEVPMTTRMSQGMPASQMKR